MEGGWGGGSCSTSEKLLTLVNTRCKPSYHSVDLSDGPTKVSSLEARVEERLQQGLVVHTLVEVITLDLWCILRKGFGLSVDRPGFVELVCHFAFIQTSWFTVG